MTRRELFRAFLIAPFVALLPRKKILGIYGSPVGRHYDYIIVDDPLDEESLTQAIEHEYRLRALLGKELFPA